MSTQTKFIHTGSQGTSKCGACSVGAKFRIAGYGRQDRQCTYNVTLRPVRVTTVAVEKQ